MSEWYCCICESIVEDPHSCRNPDVSGSDVDIVMGSVSNGLIEDPPDIIYRPSIGIKAGCAVCGHPLDVQYIKTPNECIVIGVHPCADCTKH